MLRVHFGAAEILRVDLLTGCRFHQRRAAEKNGPRALDDDRLVGHRRHVRAACGARSHHGCNLRDALGRQPRLIEKDAPEVLAIGKHLGLQRKKRPARVDQIQARQPVFERDLLSAQVLLDRNRIVRPALHRGIVGDDDDVALRDATNAGDEARAGVSSSYTP